MTGWTAVRLIRWPAQAEDRRWCQAHDVPRVLLVADGQPLPEAEDREVVLAEHAEVPVISAAVDRLAHTPQAAAPVATGTTTGHLGLGGLAAVAALAALAQGR